LHRIGTGVLGKLLQLVPQLRQFLAIGLEKDLLTGNQITAHGGFEPADQLQRFVGLRNTPHRLINPVADAQEVVDDATEEKRAKKPKAKRYRHIAVKNASELVLFDE